MRLSCELGRALQGRIAPTSHGSKPDTVHPLKGIVGVLAEPVAATDLGALKGSDVAGVGEVGPGL